MDLLRIRSELYNLQSLGPPASSPPAFSSPGESHGPGREGEFNIIFFRAALSSTRWVHASTSLQQWSASWPARTNSAFDCPKKVIDGRNPDVLQCDPSRDLVGMPSRRLEFGPQHTGGYLETHPTAWLWLAGRGQGRACGKAA